MPDPLPLEGTFGAQVGDVAGLLPHLTIGEEASPEGAERQPSEADVIRNLRAAAGWVRQRTGAIPQENPDPNHAGEENPAWTMARSLTVLGAASWTESSAFPERADRAETSYAGLLWSQFKGGLDELLESLGLGTTSGAGAAAAAPHGLPDAAFPAVPIFYRDRRY